jgi:ketosteroid isomerase-like protein
MGHDDHIKTVQSIYEAFGRGDVDAILDQLTDDIDWAVEPAGSAPWNGLRRGKPEVAAFFRALAENVIVTEFMPLAFAANDTDVMAVIRYAVAVPATGKSGSMDLHHWWRFRDDKICFMRGTEDAALTAQLRSVH